MAGSRLRISIDENGPNYQVRIGSYSAREARRLRERLNIVPAKDALERMDGYDDLRNDEYFVAHLAVAPAFQGHGLGTLLMAHAEATTRLCGWSKLAPIVATDNVGPISFYRRWGFKIVDTNDFPPLEERIGYPGFHRMRKSAI